MVIVSTIKDYLKQEEDPDNLRQNPIYLSKCDTYGVNVTVVWLWSECHSCLAMEWMSQLFGYGVNVTVVWLWSECHSCLAMEWMSQLFGYGVNVTVVWLWSECHSCLAMEWMSQLFGYGVNVTVVWLCSECHGCLGMECKVNCVWRINRVNLTGMLRVRLIYELATVCL